MGHHGTVLMIKNAVLLSPKHLNSSKIKGFTLIAQPAMPMPSALIDTTHKATLPPHNMCLQGAAHFKAMNKKSKNAPCLKVAAGC